MHKHIYQCKYINKSTHLGIHPGSVVHLSVFILAVRCFLDIYILQMPAGYMNSSLT